ncbi:MAG TPA: DUF1266 domain-containing protein [Bdellovibrio sp.]|nr:DUF1266 domain-containing protein [Bdellovibrio sp.]
MPRVLPETDLEKKLMCMAAVFIEENQRLDDLFDIISSDLDETPLQELPEDTREHVLAEIAESFFRLDFIADPPEDLRAECIDFLQSLWNVRDHDSALKTLEEIRKQGHRVKFNVLKGCVSSDGTMSPAALEKFKNIFTFDMPEDFDMKMSDDDLRLLGGWMQKTNRFVGECGILGWDLARLVHLARLCYVVGYLDNNEAWNEILKAAPLAVDQFKDWKEFALSFIIGRTFWAGEEDPKVKKICERLLGHPASPWHFFAING